MKYARNILPSKLNIIFCVESGLLEDQAKLLILSIKKWFVNDSYILQAYTPRLNSIPSINTLSFFEKRNVNWHSRPINTNFLDYPIANKLLACVDFEKSNPKESNVMFIDTDTVFLQEINPILVSNEPRLYLRPVDNKGPGSESEDDPNDEFWQQVFSLCNGALPESKVWTTVGQKLIRPYFNAGLIWVNNIPGFFQQWYADFMTIIKSELRPFGWTSRDGNDFRCLDQVALAVTATRYQQYLQILPETYNYPIPFRPMMKDRANHPKFNELTHIHYHKWFQHPGFLDHITTDEDKKTEQYLWLKEQLPLHPIIDEPFKC